MNEYAAINSPPAAAPGSVLHGASPQQKKWPLWIGATLGTLLVFSGGATLGAFHKWQSNTKIAPNITVAGVAVGGLEKSQAARKLEEKFGKTQFSLLLDDQQIPLSLQELGGRPSTQLALKRAYAVGREGGAFANFFGVWDAQSGGKSFMLPIEWDKQKLVARLEKLNQEIRVKPKNARLISLGNEMGVQNEVAGRELNVGETAKRIQGRFFFGQPSVHGEMREVAPEITSDELQGQDVKLGEYSTRFNPGLVGRTENIRVSCATIEGHVLMPGEKFSFNAQTGQRTWDKGYRMAQIFERKPGAEKSEIVDGLAGGVCQTSSTLYNAVRKVNLRFERNPLKIIERNSHSLPVNYVPPGLDATVAWPSKDFRFQNVADYPIYLRVKQGRRTLTVSVWGRVPGGENLF